MNITVLNESLVPIAIIDDYVSFIWTERYYEAGDFELYMSMHKSLLDILKPNYYLSIDASERVMIIEDLNIDTDVENGDRFTVTGRSLESILDRRVIFEQKTYEAQSLELVVRDLLVSNILVRNGQGPTTSRRITNLTYVDPTDSKVLTPVLTCQFQGENLYDTISSICKENQIGFKILLNGTNFDFYLFAGADRTYTQTDNEYVVFSPEFDNIISSNYFKSIRDSKTIIYVGGEGEGSEKIIEPAYVSSAKSGLNRREGFVNASGVSSKTDDGDLTETQYRQLLNEYGKNELETTFKEKNAFEGEVDATRIWRYGEDFFLGDIVQIVDAYGNTGKSYISEVVISDDESGYAIYPTFNNVEEGV